MTLAGSWSTVSGPRPARKRPRSRRWAPARAFSRRGRLGNSIGSLEPEQLAPRASLELSHKKVTKFCFEMHATAGAPPACYPAPQAHSGKKFGTRRSVLGKTPANDRSQNCKGQRVPGWILERFLGRGPEKRDVVVAAGRQQTPSVGGVGLAVAWARLSRSSAPRGRG